MTKTGFLCPPSTPGTNSGLPWKLRHSCRTITLKNVAAILPKIAKKRSKIVVLAAPVLTSKVSTITMMKRLVRINCIMLRGREIEGKGGGEGVDRRGGNSARQKMFV